MNTSTQLRPWHAVLGLVALILSVIVLTGDADAAPTKSARTAPKAPAAPTVQTAPQQQSGKHKHKKKHHHKKHHHKHKKNQKSTNRSALEQRIQHDEMVLNRDISRLQRLQR
jgi:hypothetical protein